MKHKIIGGLLLMLCLLAGQPHAVCAAPQKDTSVYAIKPKTAKATSKSIKVSWSSSNDADVESYFVMRRGTRDSKGEGEWKTIAEVASDGVKGGSQNTYVDRLKSSKAQQYEYKICTLSQEGIDTRDPEYREKTDSYAVLGTNIKICIDPGHYGSLNNNYSYSGSDGKYRYSEAKFTLKIGTALKKELKNKYGIDSYMTRSASSISLKYKGKKYTNAGLDKKNIAVRGYMAKSNNCDFFISLHTNSTDSKTRPWNQPKSMNKVFVFVNKTALSSARGMKIANSIGVSLTAYNKKSGIQTAGFQKRGKNAAVNFTENKNAALNGNGTVIHRKGKTGTDYYGVLRGSSAKKTQGILVEHAFHATQIMRKKASQSSKLYENWAACDAHGIAYGFGFANSEQRQ